MEGKKEGKKEGRKGGRMGLWDQPMKGRYKSQVEDSCTWFCNMHVIDVTPFSMCIQRDAEIWREKIRNLKCSENTNQCTVLPEAVRHVLELRLGILEFQKGL